MMPKDRKGRKIRAILMCVLALVCVWFFTPRQSEYTKRTSEEISYLNTLRKKYSGKNRSLTPIQVEAIIANACSFLDGVEDNASKYDTPEARALLFGTAYIESGFYPRYQDSNGDAIGLFQIEYGTFRDLWNRGIKTNHPQIYRAILERYGSNGKISFEDLQRNDTLSAIFARLKYATPHIKIPPSNDLNAQGEYYKKYYNTKHGKGSVERYEKKVGTLRPNKNE